MCVADKGYLTSIRVKHRGEIIAIDLVPNPTTRNSHRTQTLVATPLPTTVSPVLLEKNTTKDSLQRCRRYYSVRRR